jgi:predicted nucleic acid binding AN1-type Zn finger protein
MRLALIGLATLIAALAAGVQSGTAQHNSRYCTDGGGAESSGMPDCSFNTLEQCRASASGLGRYCTENPDYVSRASGKQDQQPQRKSRQKN